VALTPSEDAQREKHQQIPQSESLAEFEALDRLLSSKLQRIAWVILRDWSLASDAVQAAFLTLHQKWGEVLPEHREGWLVKAVQYSAHNLRRSQINHDQLPDLLFKRQSDHKATNDGTDERLDQLKVVLNQLPSDQQRIVHLRLVEELSFKEIASRLGIPLGTALSRMRLAIEKLRSVMKDGNR
jgi:RNA polymerase sigma-70 factor (ECF subfamily)